MSVADGGRRTKFLSPAALGVFLAGAALGALAGWGLAPTTLPTEDSRERAARDKLQALTESELLEYSRLKTLEERYRKADELLTKMIQIFVADLGLRLSPLALEALKDGSVGSSAVPSPAIPEKPAATPPLPPSPSPTRPPHPGHGVPRPALSEVRGPEEIEGFLKASRIEDLDEALKTSSGLSNRSQIADLTGRFTGQALIERDGRPVIWDVVFEFQGQLADGKLRGRNRLILSENGKVFSNKSGRGSLDGDFRELAQDPLATLVEAGPNSFVQLYYLKESDALIGNFLQRPGTGRPFRTIGTLHLRRH